MGIFISDKINFKTKNYKKRQRRSLYNDKGINSARGYNNFKYIYASNIETLRYIKEILLQQKREIGPNTIIVETSTPHFQHHADNPDRKSTKRYQT